MSDDKDYMGMSDEDLLNSAPPEDDTPVQEEGIGEVLEGDEGEVVTVDDEPIGESKDEESGDEEGEAPVQKDNTDTDTADTNTDSSDSDTLVEDSNTEIVDVNYKKEYETLTRNFKANGREMSVKSAEEAITLMQMGANYNKKMASLKPNLALVKMLQNNDLLDEAKLSYLIDLNKKDPKAIQHLVKDSGLDPLDIDVENGEDYEPTSHAVDPRQLALDEVLDDIQDSSGFATTSSVISDQWDDASRTELFNNPQMIKAINTHVESGVFKQISEVMDRERMLGRLSGITDIEAYRQTGNAIEAAGGFSQVPGNTNPDTEDTNPVVKDTSKLKSQKKSASSTKGRSVQSDKAFDPLAMSDEAFEKLVQSQYL